MSSELLPPARCACPCHYASSPDGIARQRADGVSVTDVIEAAVACKCCRPRHCPALLARDLANAPPPTIIERVPWVDPEPPKFAPDGEDGG